MDFLITPRHRWIYVAILAVMGVTAFNTFNLADSFGVPNVYLKLLVKLGKINIQLVCFKHSPFSMLQ